VAFEDLAPTLRVEVEDQELSADVTSAIVQCRVDLARDLADMITLRIANPRVDELGSGVSDKFAYLTSKAFQPGNEISVYMGYGDPEFIGRGVITKPMPVFPATGVPKLTIKAMDGSIHLMDGERAQEGRVWEDLAHSDAIIEIANEHGFAASVDSTDNEKKILKKRGMSDYQFIRGLANLYGYQFKVQWDNGYWRILWGESIHEQTEEFILRYNAGSDSTLLQFRPEWGIREAPSAVKVLYLDRDTGSWEEILLEETESGEDPKFKGSGEMEEEILSSPSYRIAAAGVSVEVIPERPFSTAEEAQRFAERWFQARKDHFLTGRGKTVGLPSLRPWDIHDVEGIGAQLTGQWELTTVSHIFNVGRGYSCDFFGHKVIY
jgi:phage protein D